MYKRYPTIFIMNFEQVSVFLGNLYHIYWEEKLQPVGRLSDSVVFKTNIFCLFRYFNFPFDDSNLENELSLIEDDKGALIMAHNGWVLGGDALKNFAEEDSDVYLCRHLIAWGDSIKLRYGENIEDSPYLWNLMKEYTVQMAK